MDLCKPLNKRHFYQSFIVFLWTLLSFSTSLLKYDCLNGLWQSRMHLTKTHRFLLYSYAFRITLVFHCITTLKDLHELFVLLTFSRAAVTQGMFHHSVGIAHACTTAHDTACKTPFLACFWHQVPSDQIMQHLLFPPLLILMIHLWILSAVILYLTFWSLIKLLKRLDVNAPS